jgi:hypothetical protein
VTTKFVRAQKKVAKGHPNTPPKSCSVEPYMTGPQPNVISRNVYSSGSSHMIK